MSALHKAAAALLVSVFVFSGGAVLFVAGGTDVDAERRRVESEFNVRLDISAVADMDEAFLVRQLALTGEMFSVIPADLHNAAVAHFYERGRTITVQLEPWPCEPDYGGFYLHGAVTIVMYVPHENATVFGLSHEQIFAHEYGHMIHRMLEDIIGRTEFRDKWIPFNEGHGYVGGVFREYELLREFFFAQQARQNIGEDVAYTFEMFVGVSEYLRQNYETLRDTNVWKKGLLLERLIKEHLNVENVFAVYIPQQPSEWAQQAIERGFGGDLPQRVFNHLQDTLLYQVPISRRKFAAFLVETVNSVSLERFEQNAVISRDMGFDPIAGSNFTTIQTDPVTGEVFEEFRLSNPFIDIGDDRNFANVRVRQAYHLGLIDAGAGERFEPNAVLTQGQLAAIIERTAYVLGIEGCAAAITYNGQFEPLQPVTHEQAYVVLVRLFDAAVFGYYVCDTGNGTINGVIDDAIRVTVNGCMVAFDGQPPVIVDGRTLVPVRGVFEQMGFTVEWHGDVRQAELTRGDDIVVITIDSGVFTANETTHTLDVPAQIVNDRTMLPIRAVLESVGYSLEWDEAARTVVVSSGVRHIY